MIVHIHHNKNSHGFLPWHPTIRKSDLEVVAIIRCDSLEDAYIRTQNIDSNWVYHPDVISVDNIKACRSCMIGDVFFAEGDYHLISDIGFKKLQDEGDNFKIIE